MFDIAPSELMLVGAVALVVIGPKDLPRALHVVGRWVGRARGMARHFRVGIDEIIRQAEMEEMEKKWAAENARIMAEHPSPPPEEAHDALAASAAPLPPADTTAEAPTAPPPAHDPDLERMLAASTEQMTPLPAPAPAAESLAETPPAAEPARSEEPELPFAAPAAQGERG